MTFGERIQTILNECNLKQKDFADALGISASYVNLIVNDKKASISDPLAKLIEETYGYSAEWLKSGVGKKIVTGNIQANRAEILKIINDMSHSEISVTLAFVKTLKSIK
jgi:Plasmid maintenance system antidote protein